MADNIYIPPAKRVKREKFEIGSEDHQKFEWNENKRKITGLINRANSSNITLVITDLFQCNLVRYKGLFVSALLKAQETSPVYTDVYAALLAVINSHIKSIGELLINRLILQYRVSFMNNNKPKCLAAVKFLAHLTNQEVISEVLGFQLLTHLINKPTPSSIEIGVTFLKECGAKLEQLNSPYLHEVFKTLRDISLENDFDSRTHDMIDLIHNIRRDKFQECTPIRDPLDLVKEEDRFTHSIQLSDPKKGDQRMELNYFKFDPSWTETEAKYADFKDGLGINQSSSDESESESDNDSDDEVDEMSSQEAEQKEVKIKIEDKTQADIIKFRGMVYSTIKASISHEEVVHKLLKAKIDPALNDELCQMIIDCCGQTGHYEKILGLVASRLCQINRREYAPKFENIFKQFYETVHRFEQNKIRNIAKFYAHLLTTESIDWSCMSCLKLRENATSSAGRCFISFLFQELVSILSLKTLIEYIKEPAHEEAFRDLFPKDQEQDIRFAINFFTFCGLGQLTEDLRQELVSRQ